MATKYGTLIFKTKSPLQAFLLHLSGKSLHTTPICSKVQSGVVKSTTKKNKPVTYEMAFRPHNIGHRKAWNSWNTTTIEGGLRPAETAIEDVFIRKFIEGTFATAVLSEVIIKRQHNIIRIAFLLLPHMGVEKICFLIGYTEELLTYWLQCPIKLEIQTVMSAKKVVFKYV